MFLSTECEEYSKYTKNPVQILNSQNAQHAFNVNTCEVVIPLIVGGTKTKTAEFPHMAAIGWTQKTGEVSFLCGGQLISERYVLTAAHCTSSNRVKPDIIRLGDQNLVQTDDGAQPKDFGIESIVKHDKYRHSSKYYDIALMKLNQDVKISKFIRPACLWQQDSIPKVTVIGSGWGATGFGQSTSDDLLKVALDYIPNADCKRFWTSGSSFDNGLVDSQMCAGNLKGGYDTCQGDSGGPIQITLAENPCVHHILGITSFGRICGGSSPGIYTRVSSYLDWIEDKVWPNE